MRFFAKVEERAAIDKNQKRLGKAYVWRITGSFLAAFALFLAACEDPNIPEPDPEPALPADVSSLTGSTVVDGKVTLIWTDPAGVDIKHIEITWTGGNGGTATQEKSEDGSNSITISGLANDIVYTFTVKVVDTADTKSSGKTWKNTLTALDPTEKDPPGNVEELRTIPGNGAVTLAWIDPADDDLERINIEWKGGGSSGSTTKDKSADGINNKTVTDLTNGTIYTFTVSAVDAAGNKSPTKTVTGTPDASNRNVTFEFSGMPQDQVADLLEEITTPLSWSANTQLTVSVPAKFTAYRWYLDESLQPSDSGKANQLTLNAGALAVKKHNLTVLVKNNSGEYSKRLSFSVGQ
jgi:hypothetical protein